MARRIARSALQLSVRAATAATLALLVAEAFSLPAPMYAMISAVIVTDLEPARTRSLAVPRILGTLIGCLLGGTLAPATAHGLWTVGAGILAAMLVAHTIGKPEAAKLAGYVCGLVMLTQGADPWAYAWWRGVETLIGIAAAVVVSLVPKLLREPEP